MPRAIVCANTHVHKGTKIYEEENEDSHAVLKVLKSI